MISRVSCHVLGCGAEGYGCKPVRDRGKVSGIDGTGLCIVKNK